jgi:hypothetical protein
MQLFVNYCFSFQPEQVPFITFARAMQRDRLLEESERGDRIALVGTKLAIPSSARPGRLLGMAELGSTAVDTADVVDVKLIATREWVGGVPRFPKAIPMLRAWRFIDKPYLPPEIDCRLATAEPGVALRLTSLETSAILAFPYEGLAIRETEALLQERYIEARLRAEQT